MKSLVLIISVIISLQASAKSGVLLLAHGSMSGHQMESMGCTNMHPSHWEKAVLDAVAKVKTQLKMETEVAFGMWNTKCFNAGISRLDKRLGGDLDHLYVLPLFISSHSAVIEMQKFMFHKRTDRVIPIPTVQKVSFAKKITYLPAMDYHPEVSFILSNIVHELIHDAKKLGFQKDQMEVLLVMHGPVSDKDNMNWLKMGQRYMDDISYLFPTSRYQQVSLRDDAPKPVRDAATRELRNMVSTATTNGKIALVLPLLLSKGVLKKES